MAAVTLALLWIQHWSSPAPPPGAGQATRVQAEARQVEDGLLEVGVPPGAASALARRVVTRDHARSTDPLQLELELERVGREGSQ